MLDIHTIRPGMIIVLILFFILVVLIIVISKGNILKKMGGGGGVCPTTFALKGAPELINAVVSFMYKNVSFAKLTHDEEDKLLRIANNINSKFTIEQIKAVRTMEMPFVRSKMNRSLHNNTSLYNEYLSECGKKQQTVESIISISKKYKIPPSIINISMDADVRLEIEKLDLTSAYIARKTRECALAFEKDVEQFLKSKNIQFKTESQLIEEKSVYTPDFLLTTPTLVKDIFDQGTFYGDENALVTWIDAKNYPMFNLRLTKDKLHIQAKKYNAYYGMGCYIFAKGIMEKTDDFPNAIIVDGSQMCQKSIRCSNEVN